MIGFALTSVFFFMATRLASVTQAQREIIQVHNDRNYLESYADFIEQWAKVNTPSGTTALNFDGISGTVGMETDEINGFVDSGKSVEYADMSENVILCWNNTGKNILLIDDKRADEDYGAIGNVCAPTYDASINFTATNPVLKAVQAPIEYRILPTGSGNTTVTDNQWHLSLTLTQEYGDKIEVVKSF